MLSEGKGSAQPGNIINWQHQVFLTMRPEQKQQLVVYPLVQRILHIEMPESHHYV